MLCLSLTHIAKLSAYGPSGLDVEDENHVIGLAKQKGYDSNNVHGSASTSTFKNLPMRQSQWVSTCTAKLNL